METLTVTLSRDEWEMITFAVHHYATETVYGDWDKSIGELHEKLKRIVWQDDEEEED